MTATAFLDACGFIPASSGTGNFVVSSAITGYQTPASAGAVNAAVYSYRAESADKSQWEEGYGAYTVSSTTLARSTITANSSGGTTAINFSGAPNVFITALSADLQNASLLTGGTLAPAVLGGLSKLTSSLSVDVALNNTASWFDGPSIAQGSTGTWWVSGSVVLEDGTATNAAMRAKLWDGTTVIASGVFETQSGSTNMNYATISLSGFITSPAGNLRISCQDPNGTSGLIKANLSGAGNDSTISAFRIG